MYPLSPEPPVSVDAYQLRLIWLQLTAEAVSPVGAGGGAQSVVVVVALVVLVVVLAMAVVDVTLPGAVTVRANVPCAPP